jgi:hypothetical protein
MKNKTKSIYQESIEYISNNINAKTSEIPTRFLEYWYTPEDVIDYFEKSSDLHSYFIFLHAFNIYYKTSWKKKKLSSLDYIAMFVLFQIIIGVALGKEKEITINPVNLFDFDNYSYLNVTS